MNFAIGSAQHRSYPENAAKAAAISAATSALPVAAHNHSKTVAASVISCPMSLMFAMEGSHRR
jgi:hypothetical protein